MRRAVFAFLGVLMLASCVSPPPPLVNPDTPASTPPPTASAPPSRDLCRAGEHQALVGKPRNEAPVPVLPTLQRVACTTCPMTMDHNPYRLNILFDADTGIIREVKCG